MVTTITATAEDATMGWHAKVFLVSIVLVLGSALVARSPAQPADVPEEPINATCPVTAGEEIDLRFVSRYEGKLIAFCCRKCKSKFDRDPLPYLASAALLADASPAEVEEHEQHAGDHEHTTKPEQAMEPESHQEPGDHLHDHSPTTPRFVAWLGRFHPAATHLPIGMLLGAAIAEILLVVTGRPGFRTAAAFCLVVGVIGAYAAAVLGWFNGGFALTDDDWIQTTHRWLGTSTALLGLVAVALLSRALRTTRPRAVLAFRAALFATAALICITGFFGGSLVYGIDHYAW